MSIFTLAFSQDIELKQLADLVERGLSLSTKPGVTELEIRIVNPSQHFFETTLKRLTRNKTQTSVSFTNDTVTTKGTMRKIVSDQSENNVKYEEKIKDRNTVDLNIVTAFKPYQSQAIRIALAKEIDISKQTFDAQKANVNIRHRERTSLKYPNFSLDFTRVQDNFGEKFEIEIEVNQSYIAEALSPAWKKSLVSLIKEAFSLLYPRLHTLFSESRYGSFEKLPTTPSYKDDKKPINIQDKHLQNGLTNYYVTNKLDGVGYNLVFYNTVEAKKKKIYTLLQNNTDLWLLGSIDADKVDNRLINSVLKCEVYFSSAKAQIHLFDVLSIKNDPSIFYQVFSQRLKFLTAILPLVKQVIPAEFAVEVKRFFKTSDIVKDVHETVQYMAGRYGIDNVVDVNDGIIFQPEEQAQNVKRILKWKFPSKITIDFVLVRVKSDTAVTKYELCCQQYTPFLIEGRKSYIEFSPNEMVDGISVNDLNNMVLECGWSTLMGISGVSRFIPHRIRFDKTADDANYITVANDHYYDMIHELTLPILLNKLVSRGDDSLAQEGQCKYIRLQNNRIKKELILKYTANKTVLDIGSGKGGDLAKFKEAKTADVTMIEPNKTNFDELLERLKTKYVQGVAHNVGIEELANPQLITDKFDVVTSFFSFTFFFDNEKHLDLVLDVIASRVEKNGMFVGTCVFGEELYKLLKTTDEIKNNCFSIKRLERTDSPFGNKIEFDLYGTQTATKQVEYLVFFSVLSEKLAKRGFTLVENKKFPPNAKFSDEEAMLISFCRSFVFKKVDNLSFATSTGIPIGMKNLYRFSTIGDGSCLFHSVMMSLLGSEYSKEKALNIRKNLANEFFDFEDYIDLNQSLFWKEDAIEFLNEHSDLDELCDSIHSTDDLIELINMSDDLVNDLEDDWQLVEGIRVLNYEKRLEELLDCKTYAEEWGIEWLSNILQVNILVWKVDYKQFVLTRELNPQWPTVIIASIEDSHFEQVGVMTFQGEKKFVFSSEEVERWL